MSATESDAADRAALDHLDDHDDAPDQVADLVAMVERLEATVQAQAERIDELEAAQQENEVRLEAHERVFDTFRTVLAGDSEEFKTWGADGKAVDPFVDRLRSLEEVVGDHADRLQMFVVEDGNAATPDGRAMHLRQVLYNQAKRNDGRARLDRAAAESALGGGLHRATVLDAMRRAAYGHTADINGSTDLHPVDGLTFHAGVGGEKQSEVELNLTEMATGEARKILTTGPTGARLE